MSAAYPELAQTQQRVSDVIKKEESDFFATIDGGLERISGVFESMGTAGSVMVDGSEAASLYQTYGVPPELFQSLAAERNLTFDWDGYRDAMREHEEISGGGRGELFKTGPIETLKEALRRTEFLGYEKIEATAVVKGIIESVDDDDRLVKEATSESGTLRVVLDQSPFYGEGGGQVGDVGCLKSNGCEFQVEDTQRSGELIIHVGRVRTGTLNEGTEVTATVDKHRRDGIRRAHSATHILHHALQTVVGEHAQQQGSKVDEDWLRFDFTNQEALSDDALASVEKIVSEKVRATEPISWKTVPLAEARKAGAMMLFGEKYPDPVRMVSMGQFSHELCGGTHLDNTADVGEFEVITEESVSAGTRRVIALTGQRAKEHRAEVAAQVAEIASVFDCPASQIAEAAKGLALEIRQLKKQLAGGGQKQADAGQGAAKSVTSGELAYDQQRMLLRDVARVFNAPLSELTTRAKSMIEDRRKLLTQAASLESAGAISAETLLESSVTIGGNRIVVAETAGATPNLMRQWIDQIRKKSAEPTAVLLATAVGDSKVLLVAGVSKQLVESGVSAGQWISRVAPVVGGGGGGKPDLAQAGGKQPEKLPEALKTARETIEQMLG
jgi:alanyl-tRNA synthetase